MASKKELQAVVSIQGKVGSGLMTALSKASKETKDLGNSMQQSAKYSDRLSDSMKRSSRYTTDLGDSMQQSAKHASRLSDIIKGTFIGDAVYDGVRYATDKFKELAFSGIELASSLIEVQNVVDKTFEDDASAMNTWAKTTLKAYGVTELEALNYSSTLGSLMKSSGIVSDDLVLMSQNLTALSGDWASFRNLNPEDIFQKMKAGMVGSSEPLLDLGIDTRVAALETYALSKGIRKAYKDMTQAEQMLLRYNKIMEDSKDVIGDYADTYDESLENQKRTFSKNLQQMAADIATRFVPKLTDAYLKVNTFLEVLDMEDITDRIASGFDAAGDAIGWVKDNMDWLMPVASGLVGTMAAFSILSTVQGAMMELKTATEGMTIAQALLNATTLASPWTWAAIGIGVLVAAGVALWKNWDTVKAKIQELTAAFYDKFGPFIDWWTNIWTRAQNVVKGGINGIINLINKIPGVNIPTLSIESSEATGSLSKFATGGIARQASIFGEAGPEMAIPLKRTSRSLQLLKQTADFLGVKSNYSETNSNITPVKSISEKVIQKVANIVINVTGETSKQSVFDIKGAVKQALQELEYEEELVSFG